LEEKKSQLPIFNREV